MEVEARQLTPHEHEEGSPSRSSLDDVATMDPLPVAEPLAPQEQAYPNSPNLLAKVLVARITSLTIGRITPSHPRNSTGSARNHILGRRHSAQGTSNVEGSPLCLSRLVQHITLFTGHHPGHTSSPVRLLALPFVYTRVSDVVSPLAFHLQM
ncbi:hypothetical protein ACLOJK_012389 [Asimina triloba]